MVRKKTKKRSKKKKRTGLLGQATTAVIGVGLLSETARAVRRI